MRLGVRLSCCCCTCAAACTPSTPLEHSWCTRRGLTLLATLDARFSVHPRNSNGDNAGGCFRSALHLQVPGQTAPAADRASARCCLMSPYVPQNCLQQGKRIEAKVRINCYFQLFNRSIACHICRSRKLYESLKCNNFTMD